MSNIGISNLLLCCLGDGEVVEQVIGQQTAEEGHGESPLDVLIRELQNQPDERRDQDGVPEGEGGTCQSHVTIFILNKNRNATCKVLVPCFMS